MHKDHRRPTSKPSVFTRPKFWICALISLILIAAIPVYMFLIVPMMNASKSPETPLSIFIINSGPVDLRDRTSIDITFQAIVTPLDAEFSWHFSDNTVFTTTQSIVTHTFLVSNTTNFLNATLTVKTGNKQASMINSVSTYRLGNTSFPLLENGWTLINCTSTDLVLHLSNTSHLPSINSILVNSSTGLSNCPFLLSKVVNVSSIDENSHVLVTTIEAETQEAFASASLYLDVFPPSNPLLRSNFTTTNDTLNSTQVDYPELLHQQKKHLQSISESLMSTSAVTQTPFTVGIGDLALAGVSLQVNLDPVALITLHNLQSKFDPILKVEMFIEKKSLKSMKVLMQGKLDLSFLFDVSVQNSAEAKRKIFEKNWCPFGCLFTVGPVPVLYQPFLGLSLGADLKGVYNPLALQNIKVQLLADATIGLRYTETGGIVSLNSFPPVQVITSGLENQGISCSLGVSLYFETQIGIKFYRGLAEIAAVSQIGIHRGFYYPSQGEILGYNGNPIISPCSTCDTNTYVDLIQPFFQFNVEGKFPLFPRMKIPVYSWGDNTATLRCNPVTNSMRPLLAACPIQYKRIEITHFPSDGCTGNPVRYPNDTVADTCFEIRPQEWTYAHCEPTADGLRITQAFYDDSQCSQLFDPGQIVYSGQCIPTGGPEGNSWKQTCKC